MMSIERIRQHLDIKKLLLQFIPTLPQSGRVRGRYYQRTGSCHQCGDCCKNIYLVFEKKTIDSIEQFEKIKKKHSDYASFEPIEPLANNKSDESNKILFRCRHLQQDNTCSIYDKRPLLCRQYPSENTLLLGGKLSQNCGYQFKLLKPFHQVLNTIASSS